MAAEQRSGLQRSLSYGPGSYDHGDGRRRSYSHPRIARSGSIVASLWNFLSTGRQSSLTKEDAAPEAVQQEGTDHVDERATKQEEAWTQAYCNGFACVMLLLAGCILWAVYCVLEPFLHPMLWAVLIGTILHPFKQTWTERISTWLKGLEDSSIPLSAGLVLSPLFFFNYLSSLLESSVLQYWRAMLGSLLGVVSLWLLYKLSIPVHVYRGLAAMYASLHSFNSVIGYMGPAQLATVTVGFLILLVITRSQAQVKYTTVFIILSTLVWFLGLLNIVGYLLGSAAAFPLVTALFVAGAVVSFALAVKNTLGTGDSKKSTELPRIEPEVKEAGRRYSGEHQVEAGKGGGREGTPSDLQEVKCLGDEGRDGVDSEGASREEMDAAPERLSFHGPEDEAADTKSRVSFGPTVRISPDRVTTSEGEVGGERRGEVGGGNKPPEPRLSPEREQKEDPTHSQSNLIFLGLSILFFVTVFWTYPFLLILLIPFALWAALKRAFSLWLYDNTFLCKLPPLLGSLQDWVGTRRSLLFPAPLPTLLKLFFFLDKKVLHIAKGSVDSLMSACIITGLLVSGLGFTVFLALQIQVELTHYLTMMAAVWNRTLVSNPQLVEWMSGEANQSIQDTFGSFANQGYVYGREWLAGQVQSLVGDSSYNNSAVQKQVLNLYDQLYQSYVLKNMSTLTSGPTHHLEEGDLLNELKIIVMDNLETVISLLRSVWTILSDNVSLALSLLYTVLELLLSGGTALLNTVVFLTTLFYLLCYSEAVYLPMKIVLALLPDLTQTDSTEHRAQPHYTPPHRTPPHYTPPHRTPPHRTSHATSLQHYTISFSRAIKSVFHASMRRFLFYGLYTWLVHTAFGLPVSVLPAVLAAIAGVVPFIGPYWIALPAILELWLVEGQAMSAIAVLILSLLPVFFVDAIIYGEIEGGHPYLTGLAVAGGVYFAGIEGALLGPILLCGLIFIYELYGEISRGHSHDTLS